MTKIRYKEIRQIDVDDFDNFVEETFGRPYCFQQQDGCKDRGTFEFSIPQIWGCEDFDNDTIPEVVNGDVRGVSFKAWLARDPQQKLDTEDEWDREHGLDLFWNRSFYPSVDMIIDYIEKNKILPEGNYQIKIDW